MGKAFDPNVAEMNLRGVHLLYFLESKGQHNVGLRNLLTLFYITQSESSSFDTPSTMMIGLKQNCQNCTIYLEVMKSRPVGQQVSAALSQQN